MLADRADNRSLAHMPFRSDIPTLRFALPPRVIPYFRAFSLLPFLPRSFHFLLASLLSSPSLCRFRPKTDSGHAGRFCMPFRVTRANRHGNLIFTEKLITCLVNMMYRETHAGVALSLLERPIESADSTRGNSPLYPADKGTLVSSSPFFILNATETRRPIMPRGTILFSPCPRSFTISWIEFGKYDLLRSFEDAQRAFSYFCHRSRF